MSHSSLAPTTVKPSRRNHAPVNPQLEALEDRLVPSSVTYHGGDILTNPVVNEVYLNSYQPGMDQLAHVLTSDYARLLAPYGIGQGGLNSSTTIAAPTALSNAQLQSLLGEQIAAGVLPAPVHDSLYMVQLPPGLNLTDAFAQSDAAFHSYFAYGGQKVAYAVITYHADALSQGVLNSHEFAEAVTDPFENGWYANNDPVNGEVADIFPWHSFRDRGYFFNEVAAPDGEPLVGAGLTENAAVAALPVEAFRAMFWHYVASINPLFAGQAQGAQSQLDANPMYPEGLARFYFLALTSQE